MKALTTVFCKVFLLRQIHFYSILFMTFILIVSGNSRVAGQVKVLLSREDNIQITPEQQKEIIAEVTNALLAEYIFKDVAEKMTESVNQKFKEGIYTKKTGLLEFTESLSQDLRNISHDKHLRVFMKPKGVELGPGGPPDDDLAKQNYGFKKIEILPGNIGYLDLRMFADAGVAGGTAIAALHFLANCDALIFDLRNNGGGDPSMIQLITSYFFDKPVHLNSFEIRRDSSLEQYWTQSYVEGPKMVNVPIYILTSSYTFSGAEEFSYNLKNLERATLIGETTGGGAHPVDFKAFDELNVAMTLPYGRAVNPITRKNWEGTGVEPHISVPADKALLVAREKIMEALLAKTTDESEKARFKWVLDELQVKENPATIGKKDLKAYVGTFGERSVTLEDDTLYYQRAGQAKHQMYYMGSDLFGLETLDFYRVQFARDNNGKVITMIGCYDNGRRLEYKRSSD